MSKIHNRSLRREFGHVYQLWEDGELTIQKSGSLFGQRTEHVRCCGFGRALELELMPSDTLVGAAHACVVAPYADLGEARRLMGRILQAEAAEFIEDVSAEVARMGRPQLEEVT